MSSNQGTDIKAWQYPLKWFREEKFWFDMTTRSLSALVAAGVISVIALASGFGTHEQRISVLRTMGIVAAIILYLFIYIYIKIKRANRFSGIDVGPYGATINVGTHPKHRHGPRNNNHVLWDYAGISGAIWRDYKDTLQERLKELLTLTEPEIVELLGKSRRMTFYFIPDPPESEDAPVEKIDGLHYKQCKFVEVSKEKFEDYDAKRRGR